jgi:hypothetical protein
VPFMAGYTCLRWIIVPPWNPFVDLFDEVRMLLKAAEQKLGHSLPDILLKFYAHLLDGTVDIAALMVGHSLGPRSAALGGAHKSFWLGLIGQLVTRL